MTDYECNMTLNISIPSYIGANGLNSLNMLGLSSPMNATVHQSDAPSPSISLLFSVTKIEQIESTNKIYWLSECLHEMFQYYVDIHKEKKKRDDVIDADEVSSSSDNNLAQTDAASVMGEEDNDDGPTPFIQHPNLSRFYSFRFVVAKSIMEVILNHDVPADGSCGFHAIIEAILHYIDTFPDEADRFFELCIINLTADHEGMIRFCKQLRDLIEENYHLFLDDETCPILDWCDNVLNNRYYFLSCSKKKSKKGVAHDQIKLLLIGSSSLRSFVNYTPSSIRF